MSRKTINIGAIFIGILGLLYSISLWPYVAIIFALLGFISLVRNKAKHQDIGLALISFLVVLSVAEIYFRSNGKYAGYSEQIGKAFTSPFDAYRHTWYNIIGPYGTVNFKQHEFSDRWTANNEGLKDIDFTVPKSKVRIMVIGDSYTEGVGADNDSSFPRQLGYILRDSFPRPTEVWNCGAAGSDLVYEYKLFHDRLLKYHPDMLLLLLNSSDIHDVAFKGGFERFLPDSTVRYHPAPWYMPLYAHSYLVRRVIHDGLKYNWEFIKAVDLPGARAEELHILADAMDSFTRLCADRNIKILFAVHATHGEFNNRMENESLPLIDCCRQKKLPYVDITAELNRMGWDSANAEELYWAEDGHCKNRGYHFFAESVWARVAEILGK